MATVRRAEVNLSSDEHSMKRNGLKSVLAGIAMTVAVAGCGPKEITREVVEDPMPETEAGDDLLGEAAEPPPPAAPVPVDFSMEARPVDETGNSVSDLDLLNEAYEAAIMWASSNLKPMPRGLTMEQQMNWDPGAGPEIKTLDDLVKLGVIKAVPQAPEGKQYAIEGGRVVLKDGQ